MSAWITFLLGSAVGAAFVLLRAGTGGAWPPERQRPGHGPRHSRRLRQERDSWLR